MDDPGEEVKAVEDAIEDATWAVARTIAEIAQRAGERDVNGTLDARRALESQGRHVGRLSEAGQADVLGHRWRRGDPAANLGHSSPHHFLPYLRRPAIARSVHAPGSPCDRLEAANAEHLQASLSRTAASPSSKRMRPVSTHGDSERSSGGRSSVGRRAGRLEVELRRMRALCWRREVDRSRFLPQ